MTGLSARHLPDHHPGAGSVETCTATYTTTQADVDRGAVVNTAAVDGHQPPRCGR